MAFGGDAWLIKADSAGNVMWDLTIGVGSTVGDGIREVRQTSDNGYILAGTVTTTNAKQARLIKVNGTTGVIEVLGPDSESKRINTIDYMGRTIDPNTVNTPLIHIYEDGSVKRTMIIGNQ